MLVRGPLTLWQVALFSVALRKDDIKDLMKNGVRVMLDVAPLNKLTTSWGDIKSQ